DCQISSISSTSRPIRNGFRYFSIAVSTTSARWVKVAQPQPWRPGSLVSTLTTTRRMSLGAVRMVRTSRIFTGAVARTARSYSRLAGGDATRAAVSASRTASTDAPPSESARTAWRRFIVPLLSPMGQRAVGPPEDVAPSGLGALADGREPLQVGRHPEARPLVRVRL